MATPWSAPVLTSGTVPRSDPQFGAVPLIAQVRNVRTVKAGDTVRVGPLALTAQKLRATAPVGPGARVPARTAPTWSMWILPRYQRTGFCLRGAASTRMRTSRRASTRWSVSRAAFWNPEASGATPRAAKGELGATSDPSACRRLVARDAYAASRPRLALERRQLGAGLQSDRTRVRQLKAFSLVRATSIVCRPSRSSCSCTMRSYARHCAIALS